MDGDVGGQDVVQIGERDHASDRRHIRRALQGPAAGRSCRSNHRRAVGANQVAKGILDPKHRLVGEEHARKRGGRRLRLNREPISGRRTHRDSGRGSAGEAGGCELNGDVGCHIVRQVRERHHATHSRHVDSPLQRAAAGQAQGCHHRVTVAAAQIAELIFDPNHRLLREGHSRRRRYRGLRQDRQLAGRRRGDGHIRGSDRGQAGTGEVDIDGLGQVVRQVAEGRHTGIDGDAGGSLQAG